jgi:hypothetical protein
MDCDTMTNCVATCIRCRMRCRADVIYAQAQHVQREFSIDLLVNSYQNNQIHIAVDCSGSKRIRIQVKNTEHAKQHSEQFVTPIMKMLTPPLLRLLHLELVLESRH